RRERERRRRAGQHCRQRRLRCAARGTHIEGRQGSTRRRRGPRREEAMIMRTLSVVLISTAVGAGAIGAAVKMNPAPVAMSEDHDWEKSRPGPDSGRVAILIDALGRTDPVVCELIADQLGNFWFGGGREGVGRLAAASATVQVAKDSIGGTITD